MSSQPGGFDFEQLRKMLEQMGIDPSSMGMDLEQIMRQVQQMQGPGGAMYFGMTPADQDPDAAWRTTVTAATQLVQQENPDVPVVPLERSAIVDAERIVQSWLDEHTSWRGPEQPAQALRRTEWLQATSDGWRTLVEPIIEGLGNALERTGGDDSELAGLTSMFAPMMRTSASMLYRDTLKRVLADVASHTLTGSEIGIHLLEGHRVRVLPSNIAEFTRDLEMPETDVVMFLLLREACRERLFAHVGWLSPQLSALLAHFAREIRIDLDQIASEFDPAKLEGASMEDIMAVGERMRGSFFKPASTETQLEILGRLELLLALVEGWVDHVSARVTEKWMPNAGQLIEILRRRRASNGPTQHVLADLIGLHLRPRLVRDAENLWAAVEHERGADGRDEVWRHPDVLPTAEDLADPLAWTGRSAEAAAPQEDDLDRELRELLGNEGDDPA